MQECYYCKFDDIRGKIRRGRGRKRKGANYFLFIFNLFLFAKEKISV